MLNPTLHCMLLLLLCGDAHTWRVPVLPHSNRLVVSPSADYEVPRFAYRLATHGDAAIVTIMNDLDFENGAEVWLYERTGSGIWRPKRQLPRPAEMRGGWFGAALAMNETWIAVSAPGYKAGVVFVYRREQVLAGKVRPVALTRAECRQCEHRDFGSCIAMSGNRLLVGSPSGHKYRSHQFGGVECDNPFGSAFVFVAAEDGKWRLEEELKNRDERSDFGRVVDIDDDLIAVSTGVSAVEINVWLPGEVVLFRRGEDAWRREAVLRSPREQLVGAFGGSVAVDRQRVVVAVASGGRMLFSVCVFERGRAAEEWRISAWLAAPKGHVAGMARHVDIEGDWIVTGAPRTYMDAEGSGMFVCYHRTGDGWAEVGLVTYPGEGQWGWFGDCGALSRGQLVVGIPARGSQALRSHRLDASKNASDDSEAQDTE